LTWITLAMGHRRNSSSLAGVRRNLRAAIGWSTAMLIARVFLGEFSGGRKARE
jgi:hypothetical protein